MTQKEALKTFLKLHDLSDIKAHCLGELFEYSHDEFTAYYGNGELILTNDDFNVSYVIDRIGFNEFLIEY